jgi:hypothetical protein
MYGKMPYENQAKTESATEIIEVNVPAEMSSLGPVNRPSSNVSFLSGPPFMIFEFGNDWR